MPNFLAEVYWVYLLYFALFAHVAKSQRKQNETIHYSDEAEACRGICDRRFPAKGIPREAPDTEQHVPPVDTCIRRRAAPSPRRRDDRIWFPTTEERLRPEAKDHRVPFASQLHCELPSQDQSLEFGCKPLKTQCPRNLCADCPVRFRQAVQMVAKAGIEPATRGFSVRCSTN